MSDINRVENKIEELRAEIGELRILRQQLREVSGNLIGVLDREEYDEELVKEIENRAEKVESATKKCKEIIEKFERIDYISNKLSILDESEGRKGFNKDDINSFSPDAMSRLIVLYEKIIIDEENKRNEYLKNREICQRFKSLKFKEPEKYPEQQRVLQEAQLKADEKSPFIREYDLFCQCVSEEDSNKIFDAVEENIESFEKLFGNGFSNIERALYRQRIIFDEEKPEKKEEKSICVPTMEELGIADGQLQSSVARPPKNASFLVGSTTNRAVFPVIIEATEMPEFSIEALQKRCGNEHDSQIEDAVKFLYRKGYLIKHSYSNGKSEAKYSDTYAATPEGRSVFAQDICVEAIKKAIPDFCVSKNNKGAYNATRLTLAGYFRVSMCLFAMMRCSEVSGGKWPVYDIKKNAFPFAVCYDGNNTPKERIIIAPAIVSDSEKDAISDFKSCILEIMSENEAEQTKIVLLSMDAKGKAAVARWGKVLQNISESTVELLCGTQEFENFSFIDSEGELTEKEITAQELLYQYIDAAKPENQQETETAKSESVNQPQEAEPDNSEDNELNNSENKEEKTVVEPKLPKKEFSEDEQKEPDGGERQSETSESEPAEVEFENRFFCDAVSKFETDEDTKKAVKWMANGKFAEGLVLLRGKTGMNFQQDNPYLLFAAAIGDPMLRREITKDKTDSIVGIVDSLFINKATGEALLCLQNCYWLRRLILDNTNVPQDIINKGCEYKLDVISDNGSIRELLRANCGFWSSNYRRINQADISLAGSGQLEELQKYAKGLSERTQTVAGGGGNRIRSTRDGLLGGKSQIGSAVLKIAGGDRSATLAQDCKEIVQNYLENGGALSEKKVIKRIEDEWDRHKNDDTKSKSRSIALDVKNTLANRIMEALGLLQKWGDLIGGRTQSNEASNKIKSIIKSCRDWVEDSIGWLDQREKTKDNLTEAAYRCLKACMETLKDWYNGNSDNVEKAYAEFYKDFADSDYVITVGNGTPEMPYLPLFPKVGKEAEWDNVWINRNRESPPITDMVACVKAYNDSDGKSTDVKLIPRDEFLGEIAMRDSLEHFDFTMDDIDGKRIARSVKDIESFYWTESGAAENRKEIHRGYQKLLSQLLKDSIEPLTEKCAEKIKKDWESAKKTELVLSKSHNERFTNILNNEGRLPARDFLNMTNQQREDIIKGQEKNNGTFSDFWKKCKSYEERCKSYDVGKFDSLRDLFCDQNGNAYYNHPFGKDWKKLAPTVQRTIRPILNNWPRTSCKTTYTNICELFNALAGRYYDFTLIEDIFNENIEKNEPPMSFEKISGVSVQRCKLAVSHRKEGSGNYSARPPIPDIGSKMKFAYVTCILTRSQNISIQGISSVIASSCRNITETEAPLFVLLNRALAPTEWMALAAELKSLIDRQSVLVIDWSVMIHAIISPGNANWSGIDAWNTIMSCVIPLHGFNPFPEHPALIPPELFVGRKAELSELYSKTAPANFLYGGRQLGKTAIFKFVSETSSDVVTITENAIRCKSGEMIVEMISYALQRQFSDSESDCKPAKSWEELCNKLKKKTDELQKESKKLFLQIDEADSFLDHLRREYEKGYNSAEDPIQMLNLLEEKSGGNFRFAFAGKHNVCRFYEWCQEAGIDWVQKAPKIQVKPFSYGEAEELLDKLKYFGIHFEDGTDKIEKLVIFNEANYYPGLIHLFCHEAIKLVNERWKQKRWENASDVETIGILTREDVRSIIENDTFQKMQKELFNITIRLEKDNEDVYRCIVYALAQLSLDTGNQAFTAGEIHDVCANFRILGKLEIESIQNYMEELYQLSILDKIGDKYSFKRDKYRDYLRNEGSEDDDDITYTFWELENEH